MRPNLALLPLLQTVDRLRYAIFLLVFFIPVRSLDRVFNPQFLNEDGTVLFVDAYNDGWWSLVYPYSGYLITYQRLVAWVSSFFPFSWQPGFFQCGALVSVVLLLQFFGEARSPFKPAVLAALLFVMSPFDGSVLFNLTNSQWVLGLLLLLLIASDHPKSVAAERFELGLLVIISLSGPFALLFSPLVLWRWLKEGGRRGKLLALVILPCAILQGTIMIFTYTARVTGEFSISNVAWTRAIAATFARFPSILSKEGPVAVSYPLLSLLCVLALALMLLFSSIKKRRYHVIHLLAGGLIVGVAALIAYRGEPETLLFRPRYALIPTMAIYLSAIDLFTTQYVSSRILALFVGLVLLTGLSEFITEPLDDFKWKEASACIGGSQPCVVPLNWKNRHIAYSQLGRSARGYGTLRNVSYRYP